MTEFINRKSSSFNANNGNGAMKTSWGDTMPTELIGTLMGKFEKNELYTFLAGCAVSLAILTAIVDSSIIKADMPMIIIRFAFFFILSTACVYATYAIFIFILFFLFRQMISKETKLGKCCIERYGRQRYLFLPAYAQLQEARHILSLITVALLLMAPWMCNILQVYGFPGWSIWLYGGLIIVLVLLVIRSSFFEYIYDLCVRENKLLISNDQTQYINWLNTQNTEAG